MKEVIAALLALRAEYEAALPAEIVELREALEAARGAGVDQEAMERARTLAHRLHGTAGSFGFSEVSQLAGRIEEALDERGDEAWAEVDLALSSLSPDGTGSRPDPGWPR